MLFSWPQGISGVFGLGFPRGSVISRSLLQYPDHYDGQSALHKLEQLHTSDLLYSPSFAHIDPFLSDAPLLSSLVESSNLSYPMFSLVLNETGGLFTWGAVAPEILPTDTERGLVEWHNVVPFPSGNSSAAANDTSNLDATALGSYVYWALRLTGAGVNGSASTLTPTYSQVGNRPLALIDSGTSAIFGPPSDVESLFSKIQDSRHVGNGQWVVPCDTKVKMYFSFGSARNLTLRPEEYIIGPAAAPSNLCYAWPAASQGGSDGIDWIFGLPFLRTVYSIFSYGIDTKEPPKIGFYPLQQQANTTNSTIIFAPEPAESLSSFLAQATTVNSVLPNSLVSVPTPSTTSPYVFANATYTPSIGLVPTAVGANSTYSAMISAQNGITALPALANNTTPLPVPTNPASEKAADGALSASIPSLMAISSLVALSTAWVSIWDSFSAFGPL